MILATDLTDQKLIGQGCSLQCNCVTMVAGGGGLDVMLNASPYSSSIPPFSAGINKGTPQES